ncbi:hypothetical protein Cva_01016 [Caedimonas varicaedens]|uniref:Uncharacterized protein n=1 Tax=Caedimonas varicaedens TaxID=1629334 RepID=A0A0K8MEQ3_9PROT|nr:hypothetical protein Cva_01016 [Caedimonas varicaedens]
MRHARQVSNDGVPSYVLTQGKRQFWSRDFIIMTCQKFSQINSLSYFIGKLDADGIMSGDHGNTRRQCTHGACNIVCKTNDARSLDTGCWDQLIERYNWPGMYFCDFSPNTKILKYCHQISCAFKQTGFIDRRFRIFSRRWC